VAVEERFLLIHQVMVVVHLHTADGYFGLVKIAIQVHPIHK